MSRQIDRVVEYFSDQDFPDVIQLRISYHKARKHWRCEAGCKEGIQPGEQYKLWVGMLDGEFTVIREHVGQHCMDEPEDYVELEY